MAFEIVEKPTVFPTKRIWLLAPHADGYAATLANPQGVVLVVPSQGLLRQRIQLYYKTFSTFRRLEMPSQQIQWFPGHMAKTRRLISENIKNVDIVIELLDARIPRSSKNPEIKKLCESRPTLTLLTKA